MSGKRLTETEKLDYTRKESDLARTRRQASTPIKKLSENTRNSLSESSDDFQSFNETIKQELEDLSTDLSVSDFCEDLVNLSINTVFEKVKIPQVKIPQDKMALSVDKMLNMLPTFSGRSNDVSSFIRIGDLILTKVPPEDTVSEGLLVQTALSKLTDAAQFIYKNGTTYKTWDELKTELNKQFKKKLRTVDIDRALNQITHGPKESVADFALRLKEIWYLFGETLSEIKDEVILKHCREEFEAKIVTEFKDRLRPPLRHWLKSTKFATFFDAIEYAEKEEARAYNITPNILDTEITRHEGKNTRQTASNYLAGQTRQETRRCFNCNKIGHLAPNCRNRSQPPIYRNQNINRGFNPNFNRNIPAHQNQNVAVNNRYQSKNYGNGRQPPNIRRIHSYMTDDANMGHQTYYQ